mmetsp:Transcript_15512/g.19852  ORF Transcript_15512/g.19852 Transcript_15512/m.19852 type:complete len:395 (-) Transcript_15512:194-1378(-)
MAISVFSGEVNRTWIFQDPETSKEHIVTLYHDTISGVRCAMLDYEEIPGSMGTSMIFGSSGGTTLVFTVNGKTGFVRISRRGLVGFRYECVINGEEVPESTAHVSDNSEERYTVNIKQAVTTKSESVNIIAWYEIETVRPSDEVTTIVHRRFKDFTSLDAEIRAALKGNHLSSSLPRLPSKSVKLLTTHSSPEFIEERRADLELYLRKLINMPHVPQMYQLHSFLGIVKTVREYSVVFRSFDLGISLEPTSQSESPACIGNILNQELEGKVSPGDVLSKVNGKPVSRKTYQEVLQKIGATPRPLILCFIRQVQTTTYSNVEDPCEPQRELPVPTEQMSAVKVDEATPTDEVDGAGLNEKVDEAVLFEKIDDTNEVEQEENADTPKFEAGEVIGL